ncbi:IS66 family insertion sequence element accessory protein TnpB [Pseudomonas sp. KU26590]|uniref:IS66 family insertion sequence element accessory protein TnpB n=1 Tax=Pseudomonas sp. KU26590 TaxID=2991051 RepID=UPI0039FC78D8
MFCAAQPHCTYLFANRRAMGMKVLAHDGIGVWLAARRLNQGIDVTGQACNKAGNAVGYRKTRVLALSLPRQASVLVVRSNS